MLSSLQVKSDRFILSTIDHVTCSLTLIPIPCKQASVVVRDLIDHVLSVFGPPATNSAFPRKGIVEPSCERIAKELQSIFGYTAAYRPQGNSVLERVHRTVHNILAMYNNLACAYGAELLPLVQLHLAQHGVLQIFGKNAPPRCLRWRSHPPSLSNLLLEFPLPTRRRASPTTRVVR